MYYIISSDYKKKDKLSDASTYEEAKAHAKIIANESSDYKNGYKITQNIRNIP